MPLKSTRDRRHTDGAGRGPDGPTARIMPPPTCSRPTSTGGNVLGAVWYGGNRPTNRPPTSDGHRNRPTANPANVLERFGYWCNRSQPPTANPVATSDGQQTNQPPNRNTANQPPACWHEEQQEQEQTNGQHVCSQPNQPRQPQTGNRPTNRPTGTDQRPTLLHVYIYIMYRNRNTPRPCWPSEVATNPARLLAVGYNKKQ